VGSVGRLHHALDLLIDVVSKARTRSRARSRAARLLVVIAACVATPACASADPEPARALAGPVPATFTAEQAQRGQRVFTSVCATCHGRNEFSGPIFALTWMEDPVGNLYEFASANMPQDAPGSLPPEDYAAVVAYLLQLNGRAPGPRELPADPERLAGMRW
jgi:S-disulfanyl-L-cysteine oxidoreductase SoxD